MRMIVLIILLSHTIGMPVLAGERTITWYQPDFPPYVILDPSESQLGIDNQIVRFMIEHLPGYEHRYRTATYSRIMDQMKMQANGIITPLFITAERRRFIHYSKTASYLVLPNAVIIKKTSLPRFQPVMNREGKLDLEAAVRSETVVFGNSNGRSYSGIIDRVIRRHHGSPSIWTRSGSDISAGLLKMLAIDRIDAWIAFPVELRFTARQCEIDAHQFMVLSVADMEPFTPVYFGAPKTPWGRTIVGRLNEVLSHRETIASFLDYYAGWLDADSKKKYRQMAKDFYGYDPWTTENGEPAKSKLR